MSGCEGSYKSGVSEVVRRSVSEIINENINIEWTQTGYSRTVDYP